MTTSPTGEGYSYNELRPLALHTLQRGLSVFVKGHPGVGKSTLAEDLAGDLRKEIQKEYPEFKFPFVDLRVASMDPAEICGIQIPNRDTKTIEHYAPYWAIQNEPFFLCLDEVNAGITKLHQSVLYQIVLDRRVGPIRFHPLTRIFLAGNLAEDNAIVTELSTALNNRCSHFILRPDVDEWIAWAIRQNYIEEDFIGYISFRREKALYNNDGNDAWPSPRSNAAAGKINGGASLELKRGLVASCIGQAAALEYVNFVKLYRNINLANIFEKGIIPEINGATEKSFLYALICSCASYINKTGAAKMKGKKAENTTKLLATMVEQVEYLVIMFRMLKDRGKVISALIEAPGYKEVALKISEIAEQAV